MYLILLPIPGIEVIKDAFRANDDKDGAIKVEIQE
jgi:hypothetical protein